MATIKRDIVVQQGANFELNIAAKNSDGTAKDLTGYTGKMQIRPSVESVTVLMEASTANGRITIDGPNGTVAILVPADVTDPMTWSSGVYDLEVTNGATNVIRLMEGNASLSKGVTR
jgi:hypothetical protein